MSDKLINVEVDGQIESIEKGTIIEQIVNGRREERFLIVAALVDNEIRELTYPIEEECSIKFVDMTSQDGIRISKKLKICSHKGSI